MLGRVYSIHFPQEKRYKIVARRKVRILLSKTNGRQRGRRVNALEQVTGRTTNPSQRMSFNTVCLFAATEITELFIGRKK